MQFTELQVFNMSDKKEKKNDFVWVYSKLASHNTFCAYDDNEGSRLKKKIVKRVSVKGGHGIMGKKHMITPYGVPTKILRSDYELLMSEKGQCPQFKRKIDRGFLYVDLSGKELTKKEQDKIVNDLSDDEKSKPLNKKSIKDKNSKVKVNEKVDEDKYN
jgi:hypothetical protein